jgi:hypothetical protein
LYPVKFLFAQISYEHNFIKQKYLPASNSGYNNAAAIADVNSMLVGGGFASGRQGVGTPYYYFEVLWDVAGNAYSPYVDQLARSIPIFQGGIQIPLFQGNGGHRRE